MEDKASFLELLVNLIIWGSLYVNSRHVFRYPFILNTKRLHYIYFLVLVFCLFPFFGGDYYHYLEIFNDTQNGNSHHIEEVYIWIITHLGFSYHFFRCIVWGVGLCLLLWAYRRINCNYYLSVGIFAIIYLLWFSYARASLAMSFIFIGLSFLAEPIYKHKKFSYFLGLCLMACSIFFHRTAIIGIATAISGLFLNNPKKRSVLLVSIVFPLGIILLSFILNKFMSFDLGYDDYITGRHRDEYLLSESTGGLSEGLGPYIQTLLTRVPLFIIAFSYIYYAVKGYFKMFSRSSRIVSSYSFLTILLALAFLCDLGYNTYVIYYRTLTFAMIPSAVFLSEMKRLNYTPKLFNIIWGISVLGAFYTLIYSTYCTIVG